MKQYTIHVDDVTKMFFQNVADNVGLPLEKVFEDALFRYAGELASQAISEIGERLEEDLNQNLL